jgi:hypothetical protein
MRKPHLTALIYAAWMPAVYEAEPHRRWARELDDCINILVDIREKTGDL